VNNQKNGLGLTGPGWPEKQKPIFLFGPVGTSLGCPGPARASFSLAFFGISIFGQNRNTQRNSIEIKFQQHTHLSRQLPKQFAIMTALRTTYCVTEYHSSKSC